jgi:CubicO group peptidase (beta-lactamase class C family)
MVLIGFFLTDKIIIIVTSSALAYEPHSNNSPELRRVAQLGRAETSNAAVAMTAITTANGSFKISDHLKQIIQSRTDNGGTGQSNAAVVIGLVNPLGTQFYVYGKMSAANQTTVDKNTIFDIGSITKTFTTILLADMANQGIVNLNDPIQKYLPTSVKAPT